MTSIESSRLFVRSPADLIIAVPYLLGFHPTESVVVVAMRDRQLIFAARADLPASGEGPAELADQLTLVIYRQGADAVAVLGYGRPERVTPVVDAVRTAVIRCGLRVVEALRVTDGRYWSYLCTEPGCCAAEGIPYDAVTSEVAAAAVFAGEVALPDRAALAALVAPVGGTARAAMGEAIVRARERLSALLSPASDAVVGEELLRSAGQAAVRTALDRHRVGSRLTDDEVAWLSLLLAELPVRDHAWERTDGTDAHVALWTDVLTRVEPDLAAAPACLLAFAAWRAGRGALAVVALDRAFAVRPDYSLAHLLDDMLRRGVPPTTLDGWPRLGRSARTRRLSRSARRRRRRKI